MGEAWFMSPERILYTDLLGDIASLVSDQIERPLEEIVSGLTCFGPYPEWQEWFDYLLPRVISRQLRVIVHDPVERLITAFMARHPDPGASPPYEVFLDDALATLGQYMMSPQRWSEGKFDAAITVNKVEWPSGLFGWFNCDGLLSASLFFCLKYLPAEKISDWFTSLLDIPNPYWKAQIIVWLVGAHPILVGAINQPSQFPEQGPCDISWDWSHALSGNYSGQHDGNVPEIAFLLEGNRRKLLAAVDAWNVAEFLEDWQTAPELNVLAGETVGIPDRFADLHSK